MRRSGHSTAIVRLPVAVFLCLQPVPTLAASSDAFTSPPLTARLVAASEGIARETGEFSAGLHLRLNEGWKTYWRSPGEVGIPPSLDWSASRNVSDVAFLWPAPLRFTAFGIENFGYEHEVVFPLRVRLASAGRPATLSTRVNLLACSDICVPLQFRLTLDLPSSTGIDAYAAELIGAYARRIPQTGAGFGLTASTAHIDPSRNALVVAVEGRRQFRTPDVFPELGPGSAFGKPDIRLSKDRRSLWARFPILALARKPPPLEVTVTDGLRAASFRPDRADAAPPPPYLTGAPTPSAETLLWIALLAALGGLVLNAMPCVLPVLSIKVASAIRMGGHSPSRIRAGFAVTALGVLSFMWLLAAGTLAARAAGLSVGWGLQFQNPYFLGLMILVVAVFAANLLDLFEINLPASWHTRLAGADKAPGLTGNFLTGAFAAVLATPCSAPFVGTAIAFALTGRAVDIVVIFTALGVGLALPYLLFALRPSWIRAMPAAGRWMNWLKLLLGVLLTLTAAWLVSVLAAVGGFLTVTATATAVAAVIVILSIRRRLRLRRIASLIILVAALPVVAIYSGTPVSNSPGRAAGWIAFDRTAIAREISRGNVVFVDVTADWCLTCKANKSLVLDRDPVRGLFASSRVIAMRADWTRPDDTISRYLSRFGRYGIPFNAVYGPSAPEGIALPELLTTATVLDALNKAAGRTIARAD